MGISSYLRLLLVICCVVSATFLASPLHAQEKGLDPLLAKANKALRAEQYAEAERIMAPLPSDDHPNLHTLLIKADMLRASGKPDAAQEYYKRAESLDKNSVWAIMGQASAIGEQKRDSSSPGMEDEIKTALLVTRVISMTPSNAYDYLARGWAFKFIENLEKALEDFDRAIDLDPSIPDAFTARASVLFKQRQYGKAISENTKALSLDPTFVQALIDRGAAHRKEGNIDSAMTDYSNALTINPSNPEVYFNRGVLYQKKQVHAQAIDDFTSAIRFDPKYVQAHVNRGASHVSLGNMSAGRKDYEKASQLDPLSEAGQMAGRNLAKLKQMGF